MTPTKLGVGLRQGHTPGALNAGGDLKRPQDTAPNPRLQRLYDQASRIARNVSLEASKRALKAFDPAEEAELRQQSAMCLALSKSWIGGRVSQ